MNLKYIEKPDKLVEVAFSRGRKSAGHYKKQNTPFYTKKGKEIARIDAAYEFLESALLERVKDFPSINKLDPFYKDLFEFVINVDETRKSLSKINSVIKVIKNLRREKIIKLKELKFEKGANETVSKISKEFLGRMVSLIKSLKKPIETYNDSIKKLRELPSIKTDEEVFFLAGLPNAGKSTLLGKITESKPKIAAYPFTTQGLNVGQFTKKYLPVQVIDTPGLLDRQLNKRNDIEMKAISAFQHLKGTIVFVVDPISQIQEQKNLLNELKKLFNDKGFIVVINKTDISTKEQIKKAKELFQGEYIVEEGNGLNNLKEEVLK